MHGTTVPLFKDFAIQCSKFLIDEPNVVRNMLCDSLKQCAERHRPIKRVTACPFKVALVECSENWDHMGTDGRDNGQLLLHWALLAMKSRNEEIRVRLKECGVILSKDSFHSIRVYDFTICQMANHLAN